MFMDPKLPSADRKVRMTVMQGMVETTADQDVVLTTVLGSCIAACLFDPTARVGGMNHYLLAEPSSTTVNADVHYGIYLMELLINTMLKQGASKSRMKAHIYGGANIHRAMQPIGQRNSELAERFLNTEGIIISHRDVGGTNARRVDFLAASGKARCRHVDGSVAPVSKPTVVPATAVGDVEFF